MKLTAEQIYRLALGALLHDLGLRYITVPYINCDINELSEAEAFEYRKHPILAYSVLEEEKWMDPFVKKKVLVHHERRDGSGFPLKQKTRDTECGILQACDAFDCFISGMECRRMSIQQALEYLVEGTDIFYDRRNCACDRAARRTLSGRDESPAQYRRVRHRFKTDRKFHPACN